MQSSYPLFHSHLDLAHSHWRRLVNPGDLVIDATCGNGYDTVVLAELGLLEGSGKLYALDLQPEAIESCRHRLLHRLPKNAFEKVHFVQGCHSIFPKEIMPASARLIVYNLGYFPGGDKAITTMRETTLQSLRMAQHLIVDGGLISVTCYPGHSEGKVEQEEILDYVATLDPKQWSCCHHSWLNRTKAPSLLLLQKASAS